jgi:predicted nucleic acid-binding protein
MPKYALDTNVYVDGLATPAAAARLKEFLRAQLSRTFLSAVVAQELRVGARTSEQADALEVGTIEPFERRRRLFAPSARAFIECGRILADMITRDGVIYADTDRSLVNDVLLAASCREQGITLLTTDRDFQRIARHLKGFKFLPPFRV